MPFPAGFNDKDMVGDLLSSIKSMSAGYHMAVLESANDGIRQTFKKLHDDQIQQAKTLFDTMNTRGWYPVEPAH
ncbi:MAG: spore coat protein [Firmicutes bacterium]|nr:spore coat protein [Bacillota bacterium]